MTITTTLKRNELLTRFAARISAAHERKSLSDTLGKEQESVESIGQAASIEKEQDMRQKYEGQGLEWFFRLVFALAVIGVIALVGSLLWGVWKWLT